MRRRESARTNCGRPRARHGGTHEPEATNRRTAEVLIVTIRARMVQTLARLAFAQALIFGLLAWVFLS